VRRYKQKPLTHEARAKENRDDCEKTPVCPSALPRKKDTLIPCDSTVTEVRDPPGRVPCPTKVDGRNHVGRSFPRKKIFPQKVPAPKLKRIAERPNDGIARALREVPPIPPVPPSLPRRGKLSRSTGRPVLKPPFRPGFPAPDMKQLRHTRAPINTFTSAGTAESSGFPAANFARGRRGGQLRIWRKARKAHTVSDRSLPPTGEPPPPPLPLTGPLATAGRFCPRESPHLVPAPKALVGFSPHLTTRGWNVVVYFGPTALARRPILLLPRC